MKKLGTMFLIPIIVLAIIGTSYALWSETITLEGTVNTGTVDKVITDISCDDCPGTSDPGTTKDVAVCTVGIDPSDPHKAWVYLDNAYPSYEPDIHFKQQNIGTIPVIINDVEIEIFDEFDNSIGWGICYGDPCTVTGFQNGNPVIEVSFWDNFGVVIEPGIVKAETATIHVLQDAKQTSTYRISLEERAVQWNEYPVV